MISDSQSSQRIRGFIIIFNCSQFFQILYAGEGESRKPESNIGDDSIASIVSSSGNVVMSKAGDKSAGGIVMKGHDFVQISYHMPASCDSCAKPLWAPFRPPPALECTRCRAKFHKEHVLPDKAASLMSGEGGVAPCKASFFLMFFKMTNGYSH